jgi:radical SAM protein with 4Fe4S-binding SPASM domain
MKRCRQLIDTEVPSRQGRGSRDEKEMPIKITAQKPRPLNRTEQISQVRERLNTVRLGRLVFDSILSWHGIPGIGKPTLGYMIADLCQKMDVLFARVDFHPEENRRASRYADDSVLILEDVFVGLGVHEPAAFREALDRYRQAEEVHLRQERRKRVVEAFLGYLNELLEKGPMVVLFDTTDQVDTEVIAWLEENVISPLCLTGRCVIIWTGRFPQRWKRFEVRRRVASEKVEPLPLKATKEQVGPAGARIYRLTYGHPMGNEEVAEAIHDYQARGQEADEHDLVNVLVDRVIDRYVMKNIEPELNAACRILAVVRQFDVVILRRLLSQFVDAFKDMREALYLGLVGRLTETHLVEWDSLRKGYALDPTLRRILPLHLRYDQPERYLQVNREAAAIYAEWIERVRENRSVYVLERLYHQARIGFANNRSPKPLSARERCTVLDRIASSISWLKITGGEPTLHPEFKKIIEHIALLGIPFTLFTNARWLEPEREVRFLAGIPQLDGLLISLHGAGAQSHEAFTCTRGSFDETVANIRLAVDAGLKVTTSTVLTRHNCSEVEAIVALSQELSADHAAFQRFIGAALPEIEPGPLGLQQAVEVIENIANGGNRIGDNGRGPKRNGKLVRFGTPIPHCFAANGSYGCLPGIAQATIDPWGNVRPCNHTPLACGNLLTQSLEEIWHSAAMEAWRKMIPEECMGCEAFEVCRGGCRAIALLRGLEKDPLIGEPILESTKAI